MMSLILGLSLPALACSWAGVAGFRRWAEKRRILDLPNQRSSHTKPTPRGGGLAIVATVLIFGSVLAAAVGEPGTWQVFLSYAGGAILISSVSWLDDLRSIPSWMRIFVHAIAAAVPVAIIGYWPELTLPVIGTVQVGPLGALVTMLWIVGLTNAYNFMDGIDGIAGGQAVVAGICWGLLGWWSGSYLPGGLGLLLASASLGFLVHNWPPARVFMGDIGSAFLGYTLAVLPLVYTQPRGSPGGRALVVGALLVWPFVFDTVFTFLRRLIRGENVLQAHRSHLYQRLVTAGWSHRKAAVLYIGLALAGGLLGRVYSLGAIHGDFILLAILPALAASLWILVIARERKAGAKIRVESEPGK